MSKYPKLKDYEGFEFDHEGDILRFACCDCGLVHDMKFVVVGKRKAEVAFRRFNRGTAQLRRHKYGFLQQNRIRGWQMRRGK